MTEPGALLSRWPVGSAAAAWSTPSGRSGTYGDLTGSFPLASVTKPLFAWAVLVAAEEGTLGLDVPVTPAGATTRHLLAHAGGVGPEAGDPTIAPETRRIYSNAGFELLGDALARAAGFAAADYLREAICDPLGMRDTWLGGSPAHAAVSTVADLVHFVGELRSPTLISESTHRSAIEPVYPHLDGVLPGYGMQRPNPWGLGVEIRGSKRPHWTDPSVSPATFGHFGAAGTFLWVDPENQAWAVCLTDTAFGAWAADRWPAFTRAVLAD